MPEDYKINTISCF